MRRLPSHPDAEYPPNRAAAAFFVRRRSPSTGVWLEYEDAVHRYLLSSQDEPVGFVSPHAGRTRAKLELVRSSLFGGDFLVAWVEAPWLRKHTGGMDAIAETRALHSWARPPLVFAPITRRYGRSRRFESILEHEFIHICQALSGFFVDDGVGRGQTTHTELIAKLYRGTLLEFEAYFVQWVNWPDLRELKQVRQVNGVIDRACLLNAYRGRVAEFFADVAAARISLSAGVMLDFLDAVPAEAERYLSELRLSKGSLRWFTDRWPFDVNQILVDLDRTAIVRAARPALNVAVAWARSHPVLERARKRSRVLTR